MTQNHAIATSFSVTGLIAAVFSWWVNHSVLWAIFHWFCGIFYILWAALEHHKILARKLTELFG